MLDSTEKLNTNCKFCRKELVEDVYVDGVNLIILNLKWGFQEVPPNDNNLFSTKTSGCLFNIE